jgi:hypothetical protein
MSEWNQKHSDPNNPTTGFDLISCIGRTATVSWTSKHDGGAIAAFVMPVSEERDYMTQPLIFVNGTKADGSKLPSQKLNMAGAKNLMVQLAACIAEAQAIMRVRHRVSTESDRTDKADHERKLARTAAQTAADREATAERAKQERAAKANTDELKAALKREREADIEREVQERLDRLAREEKARLDRLAREDNADSKRKAANARRREQRAAAKAAKEAERQARAAEAKAKHDLARMDDESQQPEPHDRGTDDDRERPAPA